MVYTIKKLFELEDLHRLMTNGSITREEYELSKEKIMDAIFKPAHTTLDDIETANELKEKNILTESEFEAIKQQALETIESKQPEVKDMSQSRKFYPYLRAIGCASIFVAFPPTCAMMYLPPEINWIAAWFLGIGALCIVLNYFSILWKMWYQKYIVSEGIKNSKR